MDCQWNTTGKLFALGKVYQSHFKRVTIEFNTVVANANGMCTKPKMVKCDQCIPCQCLFRWMNEQVGFPWEQWKDANCTPATKPSIHLYNYKLYMFEKQNWANQLGYSTILAVFCPSTLNNITLIYRFAAAWPSVLQKVGDSRSRQRNIHCTCFS